MKARPNSSATFFRRSAALAVVICPALLLTAPAAKAANYFWDPSAIAADPGSGGTGNWNTTSSFWELAGSGIDSVWPNLNTNTATFSGTAGTVTPTAGITAQGLIFSTSGYTLASGNTLTIAGSGINTSSLVGGTTTINSAINVSATQTWNIGAGNILNIGTGITGGAGALTMSSGTLNYTGTAFSPGKFSLTNGVSFNSSGTVNITAGGYTGVGDGSNATLNVTAGTFTTNQTFFLATNANSNSSTGIVNVSGGTLTTTSTVHIGTGYNNLFNGTGVLTISDAGLFTTGVATGNIRVGNVNNGSGTINLDGGTLATNSVIAPGTGIVGTGTKASIFNFNGGTLKANGSALTILNTITANVKEGGAIIDTNNFNVAMPVNFAHGGVAATDGGLIKRGNGILTLSGANTFTGNVAVQLGTLSANDTGSLPGFATAGRYSVSINATLGGRVGGAGISTADFATLLSNATFANGSFVLIDTTNGDYAQTADLGAATSAGTTIGVVKSGANTLSLSGTTTVAQFVASGGNTDISGTVNTNSKFNLNGGNVNVSGNVTNTGGYTGIGDNINSTLTLTAGTFNSNATVGLFISSGAATGLLNITGGSFLVGANTPVRVGDSYDGAHTAGTGTLTVSNTGLFSTGVTTGAFILGSSDATVGTGTINLDGGTLSTNRSITKGVGAVTTAVINYNGGTFQATGTGAAIAGTIASNVRDGGAKFDSNGFDFTIAQTLTHSTLGDAAIDGGLTKSGIGALTVSGINTYNGPTTVNGGTLLVSGSAVGSTAVVNAGGTLGGDGTVGSIMLNADGAIAPGASIGTLSTANGNLTWNGETAGAFAQMKFELSNVGSTSDLISLGSGVFGKGTGSTFVFDFQNSGIGTAASPTTYTLATFGSSTGFSVGDFSYIGLTGGYTGTFALSGGALQFQVVPEPGSVALLLGGFGMLVGMQRTRRRKG